MKRPFAWIAAAMLVACGADAPEPEALDFAVLAQSSDGFRQAAPGQALTFPADHGAHPGFRIEWWYVTANLRDAAGRDYGAQWTLFRTAVREPEQEAPANPWGSPQVFMGHMAITTPDDHVAFQRYARGGEHGGLARAGAQAEPFMAWLDDWALRSVGSGWLPLELQARQDDFAIRLRLDSERGVVLQGEDGFSRKHPDGGGSFYYSQPFLQAEGVLEFAGRELTVSGPAWLDREWSSQFLGENQEGWDWFAIHLDSGEKLMIFRLRTRPGSPEGAFVHGVLIAPDGGRTMLAPERIGLTPLETTMVAGRELPLRWRVDLPQLGRAFEVAALHPDQWLDVDYAYWEGVIRATGPDSNSSGIGYLELTGYPVR